MRWINMIFLDIQLTVWNLVQQGLKHVYSCTADIWIDHIGNATAVI